MLNTFFNVKFSKYFTLLFLFMSLLITFKNLLLKKISFLNETNCPLRHLDFDYQEKYNIDVVC